MKHFSKAICICSIGIAALLLGVAETRAQDKAKVSDWDACQGKLPQNQTIDRTARIAACNREIGRKNLTSESLAWMYMMRGSAHGDDDPRRRLADFDKAIELHQNFDQAYQRRAKVRLDDDPAAALADLKKVRQEKVAEFLMIDLAIAYEGLKRYDEARSEYAKWIAARWPNSSALVQRAGFNVRIGEWKAAMHDLDLLHEAYLELKRKRAKPGEKIVDSSAACLKAWAYYLSGDVDQALSITVPHFTEEGPSSSGISFRWLIRTNWRLGGDCFEAHALALVDRGKASEARDFLDLLELDDLAQKNPGEVMILRLARARANVALGDPGAARVDLAAIVKATPRYADQKSMHAKAKELIKTVPDVPPKVSPVKDDCRNGIDLDRAIAGCTARIENDRTDLAAYLTRAHLYSRYGETAKALADFDRAVGIDPRKAEAYFGRANMRAANSTDSEATKAAHADFTTALSLDAALVEAYFERGKLRVLSWCPCHDRAGAIADFSAFLEREPSHAAALLARAQEYKVEKKLGEALADANRALAIEPQSTLALSIRAGIHSDAGDHPAAVADHTKIIEMGGARAYQYAARAGAHAAAKNLNAAIADLNRAIDLDPADIYLRLQRADVHAQANQHDKAVLDLSHSLAAKPKDTWLLQRRSKSFEALNKYDEALADLTSAVTQSTDKPTQAAYLSARSAFHQRRANEGAALDDLISAAQAFPTAGGWKMVGLAHFNKADFSSASASYLKALELADDPFAMMYRAIARGRLGQQPLSELEANASRLKSRKWPYPIIEHMLGRRNAEALMDSASNDDERCGAQFYSAQWHLVGNRKDEALPLLKQAAETCPVKYNERMAAQIELKRLGN